MMSVTTRNPCRRRLLLGFLLAATGAAQAKDNIRIEWLELKARIRTRYPQVAQLTVPELVAWLADAKRPPPVLLDTRSATEFADGHLSSALRADTLAQAKAALLNAPNDRPVVLYCSVGMRSSKLATELLALGRTNVFNLEGSVFEWANAGHPLVAGREQTDKTHPYDKQWGRFLDREHWSRQL
jgi:rhodanese-related sulfurtransferase